MIYVVHLPDRLLLAHWVATHVLTIALDSEERISSSDTSVVLFGKS